MAKGELGQTIQSEGKRAKAGGGKEATPPRRGKQPEAEVKVEGSSRGLYLVDGCDVGSGLQKNLDDG